MLAYIAWFKARDSKKILDNRRVLVFASFTTNFLESFGEVMVEGDWMTFLMRCEQLSGFRIQAFQ